MRYLEIYEYKNGDIDPRNNKISYNELVENKDKIKLALQQWLHGIKIYRGIPTRQKTDTYLYIDPTEYERKSANTKNYYTLLMDNLPSWSEYPKRSKSLICTTDLSIASRRGISYLVLPFNNPKIGVCSKLDVWLSFTKLLHKFDLNFMDDFNDLIDVSYRILFDTTENIPENINWNSFVNILNEMSKKFNELTSEQKSKMQYMTTTLFSIDNNIYKTLEKYSDPNTNNFKLETLLSLNKGYKNNEIWLSSPCYLIDAKIEQFAKEKIADLL